MLVATILSSQSTDKQVNKILPELFKNYTSINDFVNVNIEELKSKIFSTGFYNQKAKYIKQTAIQLKEKFDSQVPDNIDKLVSLPGVGRKTANVVLGCYFKKNQGFTVDTHVKRLAKRWNLTNQIKVDKLEKDLMKIFPQKYWHDISLRMVFWGREFCPANIKKNHSCKICDL